MLPREKLTVGLNDGANVEWFDIFLRIRNPKAYLCRRLCIREYREVQGFVVPKVTNLTRGGMCEDGFPSCLVDMYVRNMYAYPINYIMVPKIGARSDPTGWSCYYSDKIHIGTVSRIPQTGRRYAERGTVHSRNQPSEREEVFRNTEPNQEESLSDCAVDSDCDSVISTESRDQKAEYSEDEPPDDLNFWLAPENERGMYSDPKVATADAPRQSSRAPLLQGQRLEITNLIAPEVNDHRYALTVNTITSIVTVVWKLSERSDLWGEYCEPKRKF